MDHRLLRGSDPAPVAGRSGADAGQNRRMATELLYLRDAEICDYTPDEEELARFERTLVALWRAIERATAERDFRPRPSRLCGWCSHQALCPAYGGTPPPFPEPRAESPADPVE